VFSCVVAQAGVVPDLTGFHAKRLEFEPEYDAEAEALLADLEFRWMFSCFLHSHSSITSGQNARFLWSSCRSTTAQLRQQLLANLEIM